MLQALFLWLLILVLCASTAHASPENSKKKMSITAAIEPLSFIIEQIGGPYVTIETLLPTGQDPHLFDPGPRLLHSLANTQIYLQSGLPFEQILIKKIRSLQKELTIIDLSMEVSFWESGSLLDAHDCFSEHSSGHAHSERDPHFWLGVHQLRQFIGASKRILCDADPAHAAIYQKNTALLLKRLDTVHARNAYLLKPFENRVFFTYHPSFGYFARTYNLRQQTVEINGRQPGPRTIAALIKKARAADVRTIFVQPQYDTKSAQAIAAAINGSVLPLDPLAKDAIENLEIMSRAIALSFTQEPTQP